MQGRQTNKNFRFGIREQIIGCVGALTLAAIACITPVMMSARDNHRKALEAIAFSETSDALLGAAENLQWERGLTNTALQIDAPIKDETRKSIVDRRAQTKTLLDGALASEAVVGGPHFSEVARQIVESAKALDALRARADEALAKQKPERDPRVSAEWYRTASGLLESTEKLWLFMGRDISRTDATVGQLTILKQNGFDLREWAGRERAIIEVALTTGKPLALSEIERMAVLQGRVAHIWRSTELVAGGFGSQFAEVLKKARELYFAQYVDARAKIVAASTAGTAYLFDVKAWRDLSNPAMQSLLDIKNEAMKASVSYATERAENAWRQLMLTALACAALAALAIVIALFALFGIARPLSKMTAALSRLASGDAAVEVPVIRSRNEIGLLARAIQVFKDQTLKNRSLTEASAADLAAKEERRGLIEAEIAHFEKRIAEAVQRIAKATKDMRDSTSDLDASVEGTAASASNVEAASKQASFKMNSVAATVEQLSGSISEISSKINETSTMLQSAAKRTDEANAGAENLTLASDRVNEIVSLVSQIAQQTNLLALNATIEAARAGEAGRGFAVVASEVKALAAQTSSATDDIAGQISAIRGATDGTVKTMHDIGATVQELNTVGGAIAAAIHEQSFSADEISRNVRETADHAGDVLRNITVLNAAAEKARTAAENARQASDKLIGETDAVNAMVSEFLTQVRAA